MAILSVNLDRSKFSQETDIPIRVAALGKETDLSIFIRYMYYRSSESRSSSDPKLAIGQDYLEWNYDSAQDAFNFVVCDGVGQSFLGYIASRFLGQRLMDWLKQQGVALIKYYKKNGERGLDEKVAAEIRRWSDDANKEVQDAEISISLPEMVQMALSEIKAQHGSEAVFVGGHLSLYENKPYLIIIWLGDVRFRLFRADDEIQTATWTNAERWSSKHVFKGRSMPHVQVYDLAKEHISRIMAHSDGLSTIENEIPSLTSAELQYKAHQLLVSPSSDDISFIDIALQPTAPELKEIFEKLPSVIPKPSLKITKNRIHSSEIELSWDKIESAKQYILWEKSERLPWREIARATELLSYRVTDREPGLYTYKLRVLHNGGNESEGPEESAKIAGFNNKSEKVGSPKPNESLSTLAVTVVPFANMITPPEEQVKIVRLDNKLEMNDQSKELSNTPSVPLVPVINMSAQMEIGKISEDIKVQTSISPVISVIKNMQDAEKLNLQQPQWAGIPSLDPDKKEVFLKWKPVIDADEYSLEIVGDKLSRKVISGITETFHRWQIQEWKGEFTVYVRAHKAGQFPVVSEGETIKLVAPRLPQPKLVIEGNRRIKVGERFSLRCESSELPYIGSNKYQWMISETQRMSNVYTSDGYSSTFSHTLNSPGVYYCQVRVEDDGKKSEWSSPEKIVVDGILDVPRILEPIPDNRVVGRDFILKWSNAVGAEKFIVEYQNAGKGLFASSKWKTYNGVIQKNKLFCECNILGNEEGQWIIRVKAQDKYFNEITSEPIQIEVDHRLSASENLPQQMFKITKINSNIDYESCTVHWEKSATQTRYKVLLYRSRDLASFLYHFDAWYENKLLIPLKTPGIYYFCVVGASVRDGSYVLPTSNQGFEEFILPLKKTFLISQGKISPGSSSDRGCITFGFEPVKNATDYQVKINGQDVDSKLINIGSRSVNVMIELGEGKYVLKIKACNAQLGIESEFKEYTFSIEKQHHKFSISISYS